MNDIKSSESNDCTVQAVSNAFGIDYETAHRLMTISGRQFREGHSDFRFWVINQQPLQFLLNPGTIFNFCWRNSGSKGNWIICVPGHALCIKNGRIYDPAYTNSGTHILWAARVDGIVPKEVIDPKRNLELLGEFKK